MVVSQQQQTHDSKVIRLAFGLAELEPLTISIQVHGFMAIRWNVVEANAPVVHPRWGRIVPFFLNGDVFDEHNKTLGEVSADGLPLLFCGLFVLAEVLGVSNDKFSNKKALTRRA